MDKKPEKLVPEVRFKGFTDDWEQRKLGEAAEIIGGGTPSTQISNYWNGDINWYTPAEISNFIYTRKSKRKISMEGLENSSARLLPVGTVLFTSRAGIGKTAILSKEGTTNQGFQSIVPNKKLLDSYFIFSLTNELKKYGETHGAGSTFIEISGRELAKAPLKLPALKEQKKIGGLLHQVDELIFLQQRKLKQLNLLQRYIKEKTLPSQKELPKLRFLTTPYNTYKFSELFKKSTKKNDGQILQNHVISVASMRWGKLPKSSSEAYMKTYFIFNKGDIAYEGNRSKSYSFGRFVANDLGNGIVSHVFSVFNSKINFNLEFLKNYINSEQVMRDPLRMSTSRTTMMTNLVLKDIAKQTLMIPSKDEQDLLGSLYKITQSMIELNEKQQQELIYLKKYLLQKLFI